ncbi:mannonate dehydratase [Alkalihalobacillus sp. AL-G]|uniref:mannonate dehydratase n=1 Tax=Alkalihalobacillus sp. AL-G TaxID=2926399 RepID=UPI00272D9C0D|nr:mannonate dehydratase [Alkalihalobacillus sp. AL-G]WLD94112.1 mannonate dehydratase [Alkalihalobacillus sp. AL-G]
MKMTFRWYGQKDSVTLSNIRQIPGVKGIVSAIYDIPVGEAWPYEKILVLKEQIEEHGLTLDVIESVPVHEDIKLGLETRDHYIQNYKTTIKNLGRASIPVVCYNFMPVFDWTRSSLDHELPDGSTCLTFDEKIVERMDPQSGELPLPGWDTSYKKEDLIRLFGQYELVSEEDLWGNLEYFIREVLPVAEKSNVKMAIHPDDPPWSFFRLPRIITNKQNLERFLKIYDSPYNGLCLCSGSLGANLKNNFSEMVRSFGKVGRVNFIHARNVKIIGEKSFQESSHCSEDGSLDMYEIIRALRDINYDGPIRPDHGRMIWGEEGKPGYGLYDRALGATYLNGMWEALTKELKRED